jgi:hypothetical protein
MTWLYIVGGLALAAACLIAFLRGGTSRVEAAHVVAKAQQRRAESEIQATLQATLQEMFAAVRDQGGQAP